MYSSVYVLLENKYLLKLFSLINPIVGQLTKKNQQEKKVLFGASDCRGNILQVEIYKTLTCLETSQVKYAFKNT